MACTVAAFSPVRKVLFWPIVMILSLCRPATGFQYTLTSVSRNIQQRAQTTKSGKVYRWWPLASSSSSSSSSSQETDSPNILPSSLASPRAEDSPWTDPQLRERRLELMERSSLNARQRNKHNRFRQHVNPLSAKYQCPTVLAKDWPASSYTDLSKPLHLDIGCGKGGFLLDMAVSDAAKSYNYLGLEIRPLVASYARERVVVHDVGGHLDYIGCNANVDLRRILARYHQHQQQQHQQSSEDAMDSSSSSPGLPLQLQRVSIQFPDPHFKSKRAKRRVVTRELVNTLAANMPTDGSGIIFLQSDVQSMLDDMRFRFRESPVYFRDSLEDMSSYVPDNMMGVATEREVSVLNQDKPVYRSVFTRTAEPYVAEHTELPAVEL